MTELEHAAAVAEKVMEIDKQIAVQLVNLASSAANHDNKGQHRCSAQIKLLKIERHNLYQSVKYVNFRIFLEVVKTYLTPAQFDEAWRKVDEIVANPKLMQKRA